VSGTSSLAIASTRIAAVSALFWLVVRWIAVALIGVAVGSAAAELGFGSATLAVGAIAILAGGVFVFASICAANGSQLMGERTEGDKGDDLVGPGLWRATLLGMVGIGVVVGSLSGTAMVGLVAGVTGVVAILLSLGAEPADPAERRRLL
jgi:hypothetical protein